MKIAMEKNVLLTIAYDGSTFHGWQKQPDKRTVQGHLEQTMSRLFKREILLNGTSRTDAGVHAFGQRASFKADLGIPTEKIALVINNTLCAEAGRESGLGGFAKSPIRILKAEEVPMNFHARFDSKGKEYIYRIRDGINSKCKNCEKASPTDISLVFEKNHIYHIGEELNVGAMNEAAQEFMGRHDFKAFEASGGNPRETTVRTMTEASVFRVKSDNLIEFHIKGDGFLYNMVRIMTGTLVEIGQGKRERAEIKKIMEAKDRQKAGHTAPPNGLYLAEIYY